MSGGKVALRRVLREPAVRGLGDAAWVREGEVWHVAAPLKFALDALIEDTHKRGRPTDLTAGLAAGTAARLARSRYLRCRIGSRYGNYGPFQYEKARPVR